MIILDYQQIITNNRSYFDESCLLFDLLRSLGWAIVKGIAWICDAMQTLFDSAYKFLNILEYKPVKEFLSSFSVVFTVMITISCIAVGLILIFSEKKPPVLKNIVIGLACIYALPQVMSVLNTGIISTKNEMITGSFSTETVLSYMSDLSYIASNNFDFSKKMNPNLNGNNMSLSAIKADAHVKSSQFTTDLQKQVFNHRIDVNESGEVTWVEIGSKGWLDLFDPPYYYRYNIDFLSIYISLIATILVFLFSAYAVVKMIYELITSQIAVTITSLELTSGQKTLKILEYGFYAYITLFAIPIMIRIFLICQGYINTNFSNAIVRVVLMLFCALLVIDGPNWIEKVFGYDLGISSGSAKILAFMRMAQQAKMQHHFAKQERSQKAAARAVRKEKLKNMLSNNPKDSSIKGSSSIAEPDIKNGDNNGSMNESGVISEPPTHSENKSPHSNNEAIINSSGNKEISDYKANDNNKMMQNDGLNSNANGGSELFTSNNANMKSDNIISSYQGNSLEHKDNGNSKGATRSTGNTGINLNNMTHNNVSPVDKSNNNISASHEEFANNNANMKSDNSISSYQGNLAEHNSNSEGAMRSTGNREVNTGKISHENPVTAQKLYNKANMTNGAVVNDKNVKPENKKSINQKAMPNNNKISATRSTNNKSDAKTNVNNVTSDTTVKASNINNKKETQQKIKSNSVATDIDKKSSKSTKHISGKRHKLNDENNNKE